ncbi:uncharacterized protein TNCV_4092771 [Trichonephila clavipes]|nr:uncharacterized protein TNCV_4092771 [Trichonephila clavipes]
MEISGSYMSGSMEGSFAVSTNQLSNVWTLARNASRRQMVTWSFQEGSPPSPSEGPRHRGKAMDCVIMSPASSHFLTDGMYTRFADWRFIHKARLGLVPLNGYKKWNDNIQKMCRKCGQREETLPHVINHCKSYSAAWQKRHNAILARIRKAVAFKGTVLSENQVIGSDGLRPDLVAVIDNIVYIIDVTVPFENQTHCLPTGKAEEDR